MASVKVAEICIDKSDSGIVCCYDDKCNNWSSAQNRQIRASTDGKERREGELNYFSSENDCLGCDLLCNLLVCMTLLASFFLSSFLLLLSIHSHTHSLTSTKGDHSGSQNMETGGTSSAGNTLHSVAIVAGAVCTFFMITAVSLSLSLFYCYCCRDRRDGRTGDVECGDSPSPVNSLGPVAFQPQGGELAY